MSTSLIRSYGKIYNLGHAALGSLLDGPVIVEEKVDGSQFSFMKDEGGTVHFRSKRVPIHPGQGGMFEAGVNSILARADAIVPGYAYRGEYLQKPKHNALAYDRTPVGNVVIFDVDTGDQAYVDSYERRRLADALGLECVPVVFDGVVNSAAQVSDMLDRDSFLGGAKIEGVVIKNYAQIDTYTGKTLMGKHVSEAFKEKHASDWKETNPSRGEFTEALFEQYRTEARWSKSVQHLREAGELTGTPADIGRLIKEVQTDVFAECADEIRDALFKWAWKKYARRVSAGLPEWYKGQLLESQFDDAAE